MAGKGTYWASSDSQPKRQHRFLFKFGTKTGTGPDQLPTWVCSRVTRPSMEISSMEHQYLNHTFKYPGRAKWNNISLTLRDPQDPDSSLILYQWLKAAGYEPPLDAPTTEASMASFTKAQFAELWGNVTIVALSGDGKQKEKWVIHNPMIVSINWGEFDYSSEELLNLTLDLAYDYATIEKVGK